MLVTMDKKDVKLGALLIVGGAGSIGLTLGMIYGASVMISGAWKC